MALDLKRPRGRGPRHPGDTPRSDGAPSVPSVSLPVVSGDTGAGHIERGISNFAAAWESRQRHEDAAGLARFKLAADKAVAEQELAVPGDGDNRPGLFERGVGKVRGSLLAALPEHLREDGGLYIDRLAARGGLRIMADDRARDEAEDNAVLLSAGEQSMGNAMEGWFSGDNEYAEEQMSAYLAALDARMDITPERKAALRVAAAREAEVATIRGELNRILRENGLEAAEAFIEGLRNDDTPIRNRDEVIPALKADLSDARTKARAAGIEAGKQQAEQAAWTQNDRLRGVDEGEFGLADLEDARRNGTITPAREQQLYNRILRRDKDLARQAGLLALAGAALDGSGPPLDPKDKDHRKAADLAFGMAARNLADKPLEDFAAGVADVVGRIGFAPPALIAGLRGGMRGDPQKRVRTADMIQRIGELNLPGDPITGLDKGMEAEASAIMRLVDTGHEPVEAARLARERVYPDNPALAEARGKAFKDLNPITADDVADEFDTVFEWQAGVPEPVAAGLEKEANGLYRDYFVLTGDEDTAEDLAMQAIKRTWGVTEIDGGKRLMKYAPETVYGLIDGDGDWLRGQLLADVRGGAPEIVDIDDWEDRLLLISDPITARGLPQPSYGIMYTDDDGVFQVPMGGNGMPLRWQPDRVRAVGERNERAIEDARKARASAIGLTETDLEHVEPPWLSLPDPAPISPEPQPSPLSDPGGGA